MITAVINRSSDCTDSQVARACEAVNTQLIEHAAPLWPTSPTPAPVVFFSQVEDLPQDVLYIVTIKNHTDMPGAAGYHDDYKVPEAFVFTEGQPGWEITLSHEVLENWCDPTCGEWLPAGNGYSYAKELCDPCESDVYYVNGVPVSNFILPAWVDLASGRGARVDYLGKIKTGGLTIDSGGYFIARGPDGVVHTVVGNAARGAFARKMVAPDSRVNRRTWQTQMT